MHNSHRRQVAYSSPYHIKNRIKRTVPKVNNVIFERLWGAGKEAEEEEEEEEEEEKEDENRSAITVALLCMIVKWSERKQVS